LGFVVPTLATKRRKNGAPGCRGRSAVLQPGFDGGLENGRVELVDELLRQADAAHGHLCAGQILGVRMALLGLERLGIHDPRGGIASVW